MTTKNNEHIIFVLNLGLMGCLKMVAISIIAMMGLSTPQTKMFYKFFKVFD
jgi:hypothetical protein